jgi:hypothetical protein
MGRQLKVQSLVQVRVSEPLEAQLFKWSARAGLSITDFTRMSLVTGARIWALNLGLLRPGDDPEIEEMPAFRFRGAELPASLEKGEHFYFMNLKGEIPSDEQLEASDASRKARLGLK